jgi:hypothetical protein
LVLRHFVVYKKPFACVVVCRGSNKLRLSERAKSDRCRKAQILETFPLEFTMKRFLSWVGFVFFLAAGQASANIIYTLSGVTFDDGGTLTGTFTTDDTFTTLLDYDITTSPGSGIGFHYTPATTISTSTSLPSIIVVETADLLNILQITFNGGLTATGALIKLGTFDSFEQGPDGRRDIETGSATVATAPEPSSLALLGLGVLGLMTYVRRRQV